MGDTPYILVLSTSDSTSPSSLIFDPLLRGCSNEAREKCKKPDAGDIIPCILESEMTDRVFRRNWARLIQKIYAVDLLVCPKCA